MFEMSQGQGAMAFSCIVEGYMGMVHAGVLALKSKPQIGCNTASEDVGGVASMISLEEYVNRRGRYRK